MSIKKYQKPKIALVDMGKDVFDLISSQGYNVTQATFGRPYTPSADRSSQPVFIFLNAKFDNLDEQEILFINTSSPPTDRTPTHLSNQTPQDTGYCTFAPSGIVDPRPIAMTYAQNSVDKILESGGIVVAFIDLEFRDDILEYENYLKQQTSQGYSRFDYSEAGRFFNTCFSAHLDNDYVRYGNNRGQEVRLANNSTIISEILKKHLDSAKFNTTFDPIYEDFGDSNRFPQFLPLLLNKYDAVVGGAILLDGGGVLLMLPQFSEYAPLVSDLINGLFTTTHSALFPEHEGSKWVQSEEYEHASILAYKSQIQLIEREAAERKAEIQREIDLERVRLKFLHGLLTTTGDELINHTIDALRYIGFIDVRDVDKEIAPGGNKQEDIWVLDRETQLLIEGKGLGNFPSEGDTQQLVKFLNRRKSALRRTDVKGIFLVNHQMGIKPLLRDAVNVFTPQQLKDSVLDGVGLMTTWDLFRLIRGRDKWGWPNKAVQDVFYQIGRVGLIPAHWEKLGKVRHYYDKASVISLSIDSTQNLKVGDSVGYAFLDGFEQELVSSLQVDKKNVSQVVPGQNGGYVTKFPRSRIPEGLEVFLVSDVE